MEVEKNEVLKDFLGKGEVIEIPHCRNYLNNQCLYICKSTGFVLAIHNKTSDQIAKMWSDDVYGEEFSSASYTARIPAVKARQTYVADNTISNNKRFIL